MSRIVYLFLGTISIAITTSIFPGISISSTSVAEELETATGSYDNSGFFFLEMDGLTEQSQEATTEMPTNNPLLDSPHFTTTYYQHNTMIPGIESSDKHNINEQYWVLDRFNCNREINIHSEENQNITIKINSISEKTVGQCQISINSKIDKKLAVYVSNINLSLVRNESIRVVTKTSGIGYTMKQYNGKDDICSLLLPDTKNIYIIFNYRKFAFNSFSDSSFNLQIFPYDISENIIPSSATSISNPFPGDINTTTDTQIIQYI